MFQKSEPQTCNLHNEIKFFIFSSYCVRHHPHSNQPPTQAKPAKVHAYSEKISCNLQMLLATSSNYVDTYWAMETKYAHNHIDYISYLTLFTENLARSGEFFLFWEFNYECEIFFSGKNGQSMVKMVGITM